MNNQEYLKLKKIIREIKARNIEPLKAYNSGKVIHKKQLELLSLRF